MKIIIIFSLMACILSMYSCNKDELIHNYVGEDVLSTRGAPNPDTGLSDTSTIDNDEMGNDKSSTHIITNDVIDDKFSVGVISCKVKYDQRIHSSPLVTDIKINNKPYSREVPTIKKDNDNPLYAYMFINYSVSNLKFVDGKINSFEIYFYLKKYMKTLKPGTFQYMYEYNNDITYTLKYKRK